MRLKNLNHRKETTDIVQMPIFRCRLARYIGATLLLITVLLLVGCTPEHPQSTFDTQGPVARSQLTLFYWIFWAAVFVFIIVGGALLYVTIRYRRRPGDGDPVQVHGNMPLEITWTVLPFLILAVVAVPTVITIFDNANSPDPDGMHIEVVGNQWWWEFKYEDPDDANAKIVTANELHIPVDEVINLSLISKDVLHSFWIPKLAGKVDLVPGNDNTMWIKADQIGEYLGQCAEFCGVSHANMRFRVVSESRSDFDAWLRMQKAPAEEPVDPLALEGKMLFEGAAQCFACHTVSGLKKARGLTGPNLTHVGGRTYIASGILENTQDNLKRWLVDPLGVKPGNIMGTTAAIYTNPDKKLTEAQIDSLVAYLRGLK